MGKYYDHEQVEKKWQARWDAAGIFKAEDGGDKPKFTDLLSFRTPRVPECT